MSKPEQLRGADRRRFHYIYKTTCLVTGRYYIGMHSTDNLADGYMGSGKRLSRSLAKYGCKNHKTEKLEMFESRVALCEAEAKLVTSELIKTDPLCMNLVPGGNGHWGWGMMTEETEAARIQKLREVWSKPGYRERFSAKTLGRVRSEAAKEKMRARWTPERIAAQAERLRLITNSKPKMVPKPYVRLCDRPGYIVPPDKSTQSKAGWVKLKEDEARLSAVKEAMSAAKRGKAWVHLNGAVKLITLDQEQAYLEQGWKRGTGNRQKPKEVSAETRAKLAEAARRQHVVRASLQA